jgi:DNA helicase HerA-like ATPase
VRQHPSTSLQGLLFLDEADIYLPATSKPPTKDPLMDLLRRARAGGLGVLLATQSPGDLDYKCRENVRTWFVGRVSEERAIQKMRPLLTEQRGDVGAKLARQETGEFLLLADGDARAIKARPALMKTRQLADAELRELSRPKRP